MVIAESPALVGVGSTIVGGAGDLTGHRTAVDVNDGEGILVVVEADLLVLVGSHGALVDDALSIVGVAVGGDAASVLRPTGVGYINHPETTTALKADLGSDSDDEIRLLVGDNVVAGAKASEVGSEVAGNGIRGRVRRIGGAELGQVEDLKTMASCLGADVGEVANDFDVTPDGSDGLCRKAADVDQAAICLDLNKRSAIGLTQEGVLLAGARISPTWY